MKTYLDGEVHGGCCGQSSNANTRHILGNGRVLERRWVGSAGCRVDLGGERAGTVLVDLVESHGDCAIVGGGGKTRRCTSTGGSGNTCLGRALGCLGACSVGTACLAASCFAASTAGESIKEAALVGSGSSSTLGGCGGSSASCASGSTHEVGDGSGSVYSTSAIRAAESRGLAAHLAGADDGSVSLRAAARRGTVTGSTILDYGVVSKGLYGR